MIHRKNVIFPLFLRFKYNPLKNSEVIIDLTRIVEIPINKDSIIELEDKKMK